MTHNTIGDQHTPVQIAARAVLKGRHASEADRDLVEAIVSAYSNGVEDEDTTIKKLAALDEQLAAEGAQVALEKAIAGILLRFADDVCNNRIVLADRKLSEGASIVRDVLVDFSHAVRGTCAACAQHYGDDGLCDRGRPLASPHRKQ